MTLFTDSPYEKMMIRKPEDGKRDKSRPLPFPRAARAAPIGGSPLVSGIVSENEKKTDSRNAERRIFY